MASFRQQGTFARKKWDNLKSKMTPQAQAEVARRVHDENEQMLLAEVRKLMGMTQQAVAAAAGMERPNVARLEKQNDIQVSTLRRLVEALGPRPGQSDVAEPPSRRPCRCRLTSRRSRPGMSIGDE